jgi:hypothetical protein
VIVKEDTKKKEHIDKVLKRHGYTRGSLAAKILDRKPGIRASLPSLRGTLNHWAQGHSRLPSDIGQEIKVLIGFIPWDDEESQSSSWAIDKSSHNKNTYGTGVVLEAETKAQDAQDLVQLSTLIHQRNQTQQAITRITGRPASICHLGEYIAAAIFDIDLVASASHKRLDGYFTRGPLAERSVNIKWYARQEGILDITPDALPDIYLVLAGPRTNATRAHGATHPWLIEAVYCFDAVQLVAALRASGVRIGIATSVRDALWQQAQVYPEARSGQLQLTTAQRILLALFGESNAG